MKNKTLSALEPAVLWGIFEEITQVPRPSEREGKILEYLKEFAVRHSLEYKQDECGNIVIIAAATPGYEQAEAIALQSHVDMVCEKDGDVVIDFDNDPIDIYIEDGYVKARGSTLGADCGIGMAYSLAMLSSAEVAHPRLEAIFTVEEETGLRGAEELDFSMVTATKLINLDSEDDGEFFIGCAGGKDTIGSWEIEREAAPEGIATMKISISGLVGGHSGDSIHKLRANSVMLLGRYLYERFHDFGLNLVDIDAGGLRNAIPREAWAVVTVAEAAMPYFEGDFRAFVQECKREFQHTEPDMEITFELLADKPKSIISREVFIGLVTAIYTLPSGVFSMSQEIEGFVESSTNVASIKIIDDKIVVATSQRSSLAHKKRHISNITREVFEGCCAEVETTLGYPGWAPNQDSEILKQCVSSYEAVTGEKPKVLAIHAGLECGLFLEKKPELDMVSIGPTIKDVHTPTERLDIASCKKYWDLLLDIMLKSK